MSTKSTSRHHEFFRLYFSIFGLTREIYFLNFRVRIRQNTDHKKLRIRPLFKFQNFWNIPSRYIEALEALEHGVKYVQS